MIFRSKFIICLLLVFSCQLSLAQVDQKPKEPDNGQVYRNWEAYSKKRKFTRFLHKWLYEPMRKKPAKKQAKKIVKQIYRPFNCKIIRKINVTTLDPFGYNENDTVYRDKGFLGRAGNAIHNKTHPLAIKNLLLIKRNTEFDSLRVMESERLIRSQRYIRAVVIRPVAVGNDSVDVYIRVLDSWSIVPDFAQSSTVSTFKLTEKNFLGTGHEFVNTYRKSLSDNRDAFSSSYTIPNVMNTYIATRASYDIDVDQNYSKFLSIERPFYSAFTRYAGGVYFDQQFRRTVNVAANQVETQLNFKYNTQDYWVGKSISLFKGDTPENRGTNLILNLRYLKKKFTDQPPLAFDSLRVFSNEEIYLAGVAISSRNYTKDRNVLNFNVVEDVGSGLIGGITGGFQRKNFRSRMYGGARIAYGRYFSFGYASANVEYGTFFNASGKLEQEAFNFSSIYFTPLIGKGRWQFRQFVKPQLVVGNKRLDTNADELRLDEDNGGIQGFRGTTVSGTKKMLITFQTQGYSPWNVYGFRLNPFLATTLGMLGNAQSGFHNARLYSQFGFGIIVSNDYLTFSSFQFSFSYFPDIPGSGDNIIKTNSYKTYDIGLQSFEISRPTTVGYQ